jgi:hypothetical protein
MPRKLVSMDAATTVVIVNIVAAFPYLKTLMAIGAQTPLDGAIVAEFAASDCGEFEGGKRSGM